jgi:hypothetical protein
MPSAKKRASDKLKTFQHNKTMPLNTSKLSTIATSDCDNINTAYYYKHCHRIYQECPLTQREHLITSKLPNET